MGKKSLDEVQKKLEMMGLSLASEEAEGSSRRHSRRDSGRGISRRMALQQGGLFQKRKTEDEKTVI